MRSPSPARRRSPRVAGLAGLMAERRHAGSRRLSCSALLLLAFAGALGAHPANGAELARPSDTDLRSSGVPATTGDATSLVASLALAVAPPLTGPLGKTGVCQALADVAFARGGAALPAPTEALAGALRGFAGNLPSTSEPAPAPPVSPTVGALPPPSANP